MLGIRMRNRSRGGHGHGVFLSQGIQLGTPYQGLEVHIPALSCVIYQCMTAGHIRAVRCHLLHLLFGSSAQHLCLTRRGQRHGPGSVKDTAVGKLGYRCLLAVDADILRLHHLVNVVPRATSSPCGIFGVDFSRSLSATESFLKRNILPANARLLIQEIHHGNFSLELLDPLSYNEATLL